MNRVAMLLVVSLVSCASVQSDATGSDAATETSTETAVDCSKVGCAPPPPCGQMCKEVCRSRNEVELRSSAIGALAVQIRDETLPHLKSTSRSAIDRLRDELSEEDRMLLVLRVDRRLPWNDLARIFLEQGTDDATLVREAARLRKRFQLLKEKLHELGRARGIVPKLPV